MTPAVADALSGFVAWMKKDALPLWLERGLHVPGDWYSDSLSREGTPGADVSIRLLAQAQMIYVISRAEQLGWVSKKHKTVRRLIEFSGRHGTLPCKSDGYVKSLHAPSVVADSRFDPADHAWFIMANAACFSTYGDMADLRRAYNIFDWLEIHFADAGMWKAMDGTSHGDVALHRLMLRAFLQLAESTQKPVWRTRAQELVGLVSVRIFKLDQAQTLTGAAFDARESFAWVPVLCRYQRLFGVGLPIAQMLYRRGLSAAAFNPLPTVISDAAVLAEALAAHLAVSLVVGEPPEGVSAAQLVDRFFADFVPGTVPGVFIDEPSPQGHSGSLATFATLFDAAALASAMLSLRGA